MPEVIIPVSLFASIFGMVYLYLITRNKERLAMIEKGMDVSLLSKRQGGQSPINYWVIKIGFLMIGLALGIIMGSLAQNIGMNEEQAYPSMILLFGGLALIVSYFIEIKLRAKVN
jgi:hypothetical protein